MIGKKDIELLRLKTRLAECKQVLETSPYASQLTVAKNTLDNLQEQYKEIAGEYAADYLMVENDSKPKWEVSSAKRADGYAFNIDDEYKDANGELHTIKRMYVTEDGKIMAEAKEGGVIDLWNVSVEKSGIINTGE